jgi:hypothetical protein
MQTNGRPDGDTDRHDEANGRFSQFFAQKSSDYSKLVHVYLGADFTATGQLQNQH